PFDKITAAHVEPAVDAAIARAEARLVAIEGANPATYDNVLGALDSATEPLEVAMTVVGHLEAVVSTPELRSAYNAVRPSSSAFFSSIPLRPGLWKVVREYAATPEAGVLPPAQRRFLKKTVDDFRRNGAELGTEGKARLQEISRELAELTGRFGQNVLDATAEWE